MSSTIDVKQFFKRLKKMYNAWADENDIGSFNQCDAVVLALGPSQEDSYCKTVSVQTWLTGYELTETLMVFCKENVFVLSGRKKVEFLNKTAKTQQEGLPEIKLLVRDKVDNKDNFEKILDGIKNSGEGRKIGVFGKEKFESKFVNSWYKEFDNEDFEKVDIKSSFCWFMAAKDEQEQKSIKQACLITQKIFKDVYRKRLMEIINDDKKVKHSRISKEIDNSYENNKELKLGVSLQDVDSCYPPIIQSGGKYSLKYSADVNNEHLHFGCVVCMMGFRYKMYCANIVRTYMINPDDEMQQNYTYLLALQQHIFDELVPGAKLSDIYKSVVSKCRKEKPHLTDKLNKSFGFLTGLEFRESTYLINGKNEQRVQKDMVFNVNIGFSNLTKKSADDDKAKNYALFIGDLCHVTEKKAELIIQDKKAVKRVSIFLKDESEDEEENEDQPQAEALLRRGSRNAHIYKEKTRNEITAEEKRRKHQTELRDKLHQAAQERLINLKSSDETSKARKSNISYKKRELLPIKEPNIYELKLFIDKKYETVVLPLFGVPTPFHISTIKNTSVSKEGEYQYLRINFFCPGSNHLNKENKTSFPTHDNDQPTFIKELTFRGWVGRESSSNRGEAPATNLMLAFRLIKELQKKYKAREDELREKEGIVKQDKLIINHNKANPKLKDLSIRPTIAQRKMQGHLEAHSNGFRYTSVRGDKVDLLYNNIKHAIFQPCDHEMIIVLHFHLKNAMIFAKKRQLDVQFYTEVGEMTTDLGKINHLRDRDELMGEQLERQLRKKLNGAFKSFVDKVETLSKGMIEFDSPFRDLSFLGVPFRSTCTLQPTSTALINIIEWPAFVVTLEDIELVHFERVSFSLKSFDMVFIFKNYKRKVEIVNSIPMASLDNIRAWLNSCDIHYTEGIQSLNWSKILKTVLDDPVDFFAQGGWNFLEPNDESGGEESDEEESDFNPEGSGSEEDFSSENSSEDYSDENEDSDEEEGYSDGSDEEEEGKDWDQLEREARRADAERPEYEEVQRGHKRHHGHNNSHSKSKKRRR